MGNEDTTQGFSRDGRVFSRTVIVWTLALFYSFGYAL